jgi:hypothetical protein
MTTAHHHRERESHLERRRHSDLVGGGRGGLVLEEPEPEREWFTTASNNRW